MAAASARAYVPPPDDERSSGGTMAFLEHLDELRTRIIRSLIAIAIGAVVSVAFINRIVDFVLAPARRSLPAGAVLIYTQPGEGFALYMQVAIMAGLVIASPFVMFEVWRFIAPGLYSREKRLAIPFVVLSSGGLIGGAFFSHFVVFPAMIAFFGTFSSPALQFMPRLEDVFDLYTKMLIGMIAVFQMPTITFFLAKMRVVTARFLARHIKYAILIIFIVAAVLTPSGDPWNQIIFAVPMIGLYLLGIVIAWLAAPSDRQ
jgi:sec-independent protein translocase protein TatC